MPYSMAVIAAGVMGTATNAAAWPRPSVQAAPMPIDTEMAVCTARTMIVIMIGVLVSSLAELLRTSEGSS